MIFRVKKLVELQKFLNSEKSFQEDVSQFYLIAQKRPNIDEIGHFPPIFLNVALPPRAWAIVLSPLSLSLNVPIPLFRFCGNGKQAWDRHGSIVPQVPVWRHWTDVSVTSRHVIAAPLIRDVSDGGGCVQ